MKPGKFYPSEDPEEILQSYTEMFPDEHFSMDDAINICRAHREWREWREDLKDVQMAQFLQMCQETGRSFEPTLKEMSGYLERLSKVSADFDENPLSLDAAKRLLTNTNRMEAFRAYQVEIKGTIKGWH